MFRTVGKSNKNQPNNKSEGFWRFYCGPGCARGSHVRASGVRVPMATAAGVGGSLGQRALRSTALRGWPPSRSLPRRRDAIGRGLGPRKPGSGRERGLAGEGGSGLTWSPSGLGGGRWGVRAGRMGRLWGCRSWSGTVHRLFSCVVTLQISIWVQLITHVSWLNTHEALQTLPVRSHQPGIPWAGADASGMLCENKG